MSSHDMDSCGDGVVSVNAKASIHRAKKPLMQLCKRTTKDDPNFMSTFFEASRLHFIGTWREVWSSLLDSREETIDGPTELLPGEERVIFHVDLDCFFVSVARRDRKDLLGRPVAVCWSAPGTGKSQSEISSASYEARAKGVQKGMFLGEAEALCPGLITVPFEFDKYVAAASAAFECVFELTPRVVGKSIDECFADATEAVRQADGNVSAVAEALRQAILERTGCTASIGAGASMLVAKVATNHAKPDGHLYLCAQDAPSKLASMECSALPGIGPRRASTLEEIGIKTCGQLANIGEAGDSFDKLTSVLGRTTALEAVRMANGEDRRPWDPRPPRKSVSAQCSWGMRCDDDDQASALVERLAREVCDRSKKLLKPQSILKACVLKVWRAKDVADERSFCKSGIGHGLCTIVSRTKALDSVPGRPFYGLVGSDLIKRTALQLWRETNVPPQRLRGLGVALTLEPQTRDEDAGQSKLTQLWLATSPNRDSVMSESKMPSCPDNQMLPPELHNQSGTEHRSSKYQRKRARSPGIVIQPIGPPGCGKSTFYHEHLSKLGIYRVSQDVLRNKERVKTVVADYARKRRIIYVDRCNYDRNQRQTWIDIAHDHGASCVALVFDFDTATCVKRAANRIDHEGKLDSRHPGQCRRVVGMIASRLRAVEPDEGFDRIIVIPSDADTGVKRRIAAELVPVAKSGNQISDDADKIRRVAANNVDIDSAIGAVHRHTRAETQGQPNDVPYNRHESPLYGYIRAAPDRSKPISILQREAELLSGIDVDSVPRIDETRQSACAKDKKSYIADNQGPWTCTTCTYYNEKATFLCCEMCHSPRNS